jgi:antitoxin YefM
MDALTYTQIRNNFAKVMNKVCDDHAPVIITRQNRAAVVMMSLEDYNAMEETMYLLGNPHNAQRLLESLQQYKKSDFVAYPEP